jgi:CheY-like chemotaxis protein
MEILPVSQVFRATLSGMPLYGNGPNLPMIGGLGVSGSSVVVSNFRFRNREHPVVRVLVVDDSPEFIRAVVGFLGTLRDVEFVGQALTGQHGLRLAEMLEPDLVLLDWMMPGMNGPDAARAIKSLPHGPKVVLLSLLNGPECIADARAAGADGFVFKGELTQQLPALLQGLFAGRDIR